MGFSRKIAHNRYFSSLNARESITFCRRTRAGRMKGEMKPSADFQFYHFSPHALKQRFNLSYVFSLQWYNDLLPGIDIGKIKPTCLLFSSNAARSMPITASMPEWEFCAASCIAMPFLLLIAKGRQDLKHRPRTNKYTRPGSNRKDNRFFIFFFPEQLVS